MDQDHFILEQVKSICDFSEDKYRNPKMEAISPDGSNRKFFRILVGQESVCLAILPGNRTEREIAEQRSVSDIGIHLHKAGASVPQVFGAELKSGLVLMEDIGDVRLYDFLFAIPEGAEREERRSTIYKKVLDQLAVMQFEGIKDFDSNWCYDTPKYDEDVMIKKESQYFETAFFQNFIGCESPEGLQEEFKEIAAKAASGNNDTFLHRDFQSRNIMIQDDRVCFIDYQGGRPGPPGYDPASLLMDPYIGMNAEQQEELLNYYIEKAEAYDSFNRDEFKELYPFLALQRNLQIIGALSFLFKEKNKKFFKKYINPSLIMLEERLSHDCFSSFKVLKEVAAKSSELMMHQSK